MLKVLFTSATDAQGNAATEFVFYHGGQEQGRFVITQPADRDLVAVLHKGGADIHDLREPVSTTADFDNNVI